MADGFNASDAGGNTVQILTDQVTDGTLGTGQVQIVKIMDATIDGTNKLAVNSSNEALVHASGTVTISAAPAASRTTDSIAAAHSTDAIMNGLTVLSPAFQNVIASASGATTIVAAVASKKIRIISCFLVCAGAVSVNWQSHTTTATKTGTMPFAANGGIVMPFSPVGWFETVSGEALDINLGGAVAVGGEITYVAL